MNIVLACILAYVASQLLIAYWFARRRNKTEEDFVVAGRSLGPWMTLFAVFATWFGAETCIGAAGQAYQRGLSGVLSDPFGYTLGILLMGALFAAALEQRIPSPASATRCGCPETSPRVCSSSTRSIRSR